MWCHNTFPNCIHPTTQFRMVSVPLQWLTILLRSRNRPTTTCIEQEYEDLQDIVDLDRRVVNSLDHFQWDTTTNIRQARPTYIDTQVWSPDISTSLRKYSLTWIAAQHAVVGALHADRSRHGFPFPPEALLWYHLSWLRFEDLVSAKESRVPRLPIGIRMGYDYIIFFLKILF